MQQMSLSEAYGVLELEQTASDDDVKRAYRELALVWHPDRFPADPRLQARGQEKLRDLNVAYDVIRTHRQRDTAGSETKPFVSHGEPVPVRVRSRERRAALPPRLDRRQRPRPPTPAALSRLPSPPKLWAGTSFCASSHRFWSRCSRCGRSSLACLACSRSWLSSRCSSRSRSSRGCAPGPRQVELSGTNSLRRFAG